MVLIIDNYDSFTYNLAHRLGELGAEVRVYRNDAITLDEIEALKPERIVISPGPGRPEGAGISVDTLKRFAGRMPLLGVCLGMQLLFESSEEGHVTCLGLLPGCVRKLRPGPGIRVPHMGWNTLEKTRDAALLDGISTGDHAYFVHGYAAPVGDDCIAACDHGQRFAAVVQRGHVCGMQFHPERSAAVGARLLANFLRIPGPAP